MLINSSLVATDQAAGLIWVSAILPAVFLSATAAYNLSLLITFMILSSSEYKVHAIDYYMPYERQNFCS